MPKRSALLGLLLALTLVAVACGDDNATNTTAATTTTAAATTTTAAATTTTAAASTTTAAATTTVATFDLTAVLATYASTIPEGWMMIGDITAFGDAITAGAYVIDVREESEYAAGHIPGAINIPLRTLAANLDKIPTDRQVFVYCASGYRAGMATSSLRMLGYDNVLGFPPSFAGWSAADEPVSTDPVAPGTFTVPNIAPELLAAVDGFLSTIPEGWLSAGDVDAVKAAIEAGAFLIDVRTPSEYAEGFIPGATNIDLRTLADNTSLIPTDTQVIVYCASGWRAALSEALLQVLGFSNVKAFPGSYKAWTTAGEPIATP